ncbi:MAG: WGR domain-containing protein [Sphingomonadaceae bacterium]
MAYKAHRDDPLIWLEAVDPTRNIARRYMIVQNRDLFGHVIVEYRWGRIGTRGQGRVVSFAEDHDAERFVRTLLRRRASAKKRIGVAYRRANPG